MWLKFKERALPFAVEIELKWNKRLILKINRCQRRKEFNTFRFYWMCLLAFDFLVGSCFYFCFCSVGSYFRPYNARLYVLQAYVRFMRHFILLVSPNHDRKCIDRKWGAEVLAYLCFLSSNSSSFFSILWFRFDDLHTEPINWADLVEGTQPWHIISLDDSNVIFDFGWSIFFLVMIWNK